MKRSELEIVSLRRPGEKKLTKPKELRGIKHSFRCYFCANKGAWQVFLKDCDVWIKSTDYYSPSFKPSEKAMNIHDAREELGKDAGSKKFAYADSFGTVVLRQEAWLRFRDLLTDINNTSLCDIDVYTHMLKEQARVNGHPEEWHFYAYQDTVWRDIKDHLWSKYRM